MSIRVIHGDCRTILPTLADQSVQCVVTSPPYFGLRDYGTGEWSGGWDPKCDHSRNISGGPKQVRGNGSQNGHASKANKLQRRECIRCGAVREDSQIGLEPTPELYVAEMVAVFREVRRVLRDDGVVWLNLGDSFAGSWGARGRGEGTNAARPDLEAKHGIDAPARRGFAAIGIKPKDLMMIPARVALALQADGWWLRSALPWVKRSAMPESTQDRPTSSVEYVFLLTKQPRYFYDGEAIKRGEVMKPQRRLTPRDENPETKFKGQPAHRRPDGGNGGGTRAFRNSDLFFDSLEEPHGAITDSDGNIIALDVNPHGYSDAHFATFPAKLIEPLIKAGTSERGACPGCGAPWERIVTKGEPDEAHKAACGADSSGAYNGQSTKGHDAAGVQNASDVKRRILEGMRLKTFEWRPTCDCPTADPVPCTVLDPFSGAGTTALVADRLGRDAIGIDLNPAYGEMARDRLIKDAGLFAEVAGA